jgi:urease accessory protein
MGPFTRIAAAPVEAPVTVSLTHDQRRRARLRVTLSNGEAAGVALPRGAVLRDGDVLEDDAGHAITVRAAEESLSVATTHDAHLLARAAYHLGNRHVALQIEPLRLTYTHDHVLDEMCRKLGLAVRAERGPFEPEAGGYAASHEHSHAGGHSHD